MTLKEVFERYTIAEIGQEIANKGHDISIDNVTYNKEATLPTTKQMQLINLITYRLGVVFTGNTLVEASTFIKENMQYLNNNGEITPKQKEFIDKICSTLSINFNGLGKEEASEFIKEHLDDYNSKNSQGYNSYGGYAGSDFEREDFCGISPYEVYDEYDMPSIF